LAAVVDSDGPKVLLLDSNGEARLALLMAAVGPGVLLADENGDTLATLSVHEKEGAILFLNDQYGAKRFAVSTGGDSPHLVMLDGEGRPRISVMMFNGEEPRLAIVAADGSPLFTVPRVP
jgi:hypothetical protein